MDTHSKVVWQLSIQTVATSHGHETTIHRTSWHELSFQDNTTQQRHFKLTGADSFLAHSC